MYGYRHTFALLLYYNPFVTLSVRLDDETRKLLDRLVRVRRLTRSEVVRRGIYMLAEHAPSAADTNPYKTIGHLIGAVHGGPPGLSERTGDRFRKVLAAKRKRSR
jgi:hypothetical protein